MNFREYKIGSRMFAVALGGSMCITLLLPSFDIAAVDATSISMDKQLTSGYETGFNVYDPFLLGQNKPVKVALKADPNHVRTWQYYGLWQLEQGNRDQAQYHLSRIGELCGTDCAEYRSLAAALEKPTGTGLVY